MMVEFQRRGYTMMANFQYTNRNENDGVSDWHLSRQLVRYPRESRISNNCQGILSKSEDRSVSREQVCEKKTDEQKDMGSQSLSD